MRRRGRAAIVFATAAILLALPAAALAATCPRTSLGDIEDEVMCLQCGVPLDVATDAPSAKRERAFISQLIARCKTKSEVKAALAGQFGDRVLATPHDEGVRFASYAIPIAAFLAAAAAIAIAVTRWRRRRSPTPPVSPAPPTTSDAARLEADLGRYDL